MQLTSIRKMKCLLVPLELEEFLYHRRKSYLAYKVTCRGKKKITFCWYFLIECFYSIWISWRAESYLHSFFSLLNLSSWEFLMRVRRKHWREIQYCYCFLYSVLDENEVDPPSWYMKGWGFCLWDYLPFLVFFSSNIHYGYFFFLEVNFVSRLSLN